MKTNLIKASDVRVIRWKGGAHPTQQSINQLLHKEGIQPYMWTQGPNSRQLLSSHAYHKVLYCLEGALEVILPDLNQRVPLRPGDRLDLPRGIRYSVIISGQGARCVEGELRLPLP
jgi:hypothetical protein